MTFYIDISRELTSSIVFMIAFTTMIFVNHIFNSCECGAWWHTHKERKSQLYLLALISLVSISLGIIEYKNQFLQEWIG